MASLSSVADITPPAAVAGRGNGIALSALLDARRIWKGQSAVPAGSSLPTGHARLDALLPGGGWPEHALSEILHARDGVGELQLLMPTLARLTQAQRRVVLVGAPYVPYPQAWLAAAVDLRHLVLLQASGRDALWAAEQCLRSGSCAAVLCWPQQADDRALRRLQVAAESGQALGFAYRPPCAKRSTLRRQRYACASKPAPPRLRILKCRGGLAPATALPASAWQ
ncbi:translesion DNA synthesis-associated protein ImuA [Pseudomonas aeruginosa]|uniref:translesion DNA synthesis-associated protein ImuA n=1 Tax=Pseudomonas aeruginosa TaxID=287 RepID=UPI001F4A4712|nr:translesion DNA synthesis-associated protein ImuA [Pseudomonas aeruginosa]